MIVRPAQLHRFIAALIAIAVFAIGAATVHAQVSGPQESFDAKNQMPPLNDSVQQKNWADVAARIDALFHENPDAMFGAEGGSLISLRQWADSLTPATRAAVQPEYDKLNGEAAKQALEAAVTKSGARPEEFIAVAAQFPLSSVVGEAYGRAALRAIDFGDTSSAIVLQKLAADRGWKAAAAQQTILDSISKTAAPSGWPVPLAAPWYATAPPPAAKRVVPVSAGGLIFVATERGIVASKETGEMVWQFVVPKADGAIAGARLSFNRPAVLCDPAGKPQVVIVRQIVGGTRFGCLRAFRAIDGKLLWTTETSSTLGSWSLASAPTIAGRAVMVIGIDDTVRPTPVAVLAFETMTGRFLWQTTLGAYNFLSEGRGVGASHEVDTLWSNSGVAVDGADVFVSGNIGLSACLDRFDGKLRWTRAYTPTPSPGEELMTLGRQVARGEAKARDPYKQRLAALKLLLGKTQLETSPEQEVRDRKELTADIMALGLYFSIPPRWQSTPAVVGDVAVFAAADMAGVVGLDRKTGAQMWDIPDDLRNATLLGAAGDAAIFSNDKLTAIDAHTAKPKWNWGGSDPISGPPSLAGTVVRAVAGKSTSVVSAETGKIDPLTSVAGGMSPVLANEASRNALVSIDAMPSMVAAPVRPIPTPTPPVKTPPTRVPVTGEPKKK